MLVLEAILARLPLAKVSFATRICDNFASRFVVAAGLAACRYQHGSGLPLDVILVVVRRRCRRKDMILIIVTMIWQVIGAWSIGNLRLHDIVHDVVGQNDQGDRNEDARIEPR